MISWPPPILRCGYHSITGGGRVEDVGDAVTVWVCLRRRWILQGAPKCCRWFSPHTVTIRWIKEIPHKAPSSVRQGWRMPEPSHRQAAHETPLASLWPVDSVSPAGCSCTDSRVIKVSAPPVADDRDGAEDPSAGSRSLSRSNSGIGGHRGRGHRLF